MKKVVGLLLTLTGLFEQTMAQKIVKKKDINVYVDIAPLFFAAPALNLGAGIEYDRFQLGILYIQAKKLPNAFKNLVFDGANNVDFNKVKSIEYVFKTYLNKTRKSFYIGGLANFSSYTAINKLNNETKKIAALNLDAFIGYRWFPFKKIFYIDPAIGFTTNVNKKQNINFAGQNFTFKKGLGFGPFLFVGARFAL